MGTVVWSSARATLEETRHSDSSARNGCGSWNRIVRRAWRGTEKERGEARTGGGIEEKDVGRARG